MARLNLWTCDYADCKKGTKAEDAQHPMVGSSEPCRTTETTSDNGKPRGWIILRIARGAKNHNRPQLEYTVCSRDCLIHMLPITLDVVTVDE